MRLAVLLAAVAALLSTAPAGASEPPIAAVPAVAAQPPSQMSVSVSPAGASLPYYGTVTVSVTVTNTSPAPLYGLTSSLCDFVDTGPFPPGLPRLAPGASVTFPCELGPLVPFDRRVVIPVDARDDALRRLPEVALAPRPPHAIPAGMALELPDHFGAVSSSAVRAGSHHWMVPEAAEFDRRSGAWSDLERYRRWAGLA